MTSPLGPTMPLFSSVMNGNLDMIKMLLGRGAVVTAATRKVNSEFHEATKECPGDRKPSTGKKTRDYVLLSKRGTTS